MQLAYEKSLDNAPTHITEISQRYNTTTEETVAAFRILEKQHLMRCSGYVSGGIPIGLEITGLAITLIENAPTRYIDELKADLKEIQNSDTDTRLKELEVERLKEETKLRKYEIWLNVTESLSRAARWFGIIHG